MDNILIRTIGKKPKLENPIFIEGLPGIGNVGKLAVEHLIEVTGAKRYGEIYSKDFPPQVFINADSTIKLVNNEFYFLKSKDENHRDLILLTGDYQGLSSRGQYDLVDAILDFLQEYGVKEIYTLGGYGLGYDISEPKVLFATTHKKLVKTMKSYGAIHKKNEPGGGIIGASGLLLGLGKLRGFEGACFMGETPGYLVDPNSAKAVLEVLSKVTNIEIDLTRLEEKAAEIEEIARQLTEMENMGKDKNDELGYIG